ncbi:MAG: hypothetical protein A2855_02720 [Candidatus Liptonbacteria bacterium RIFCSPHIGHO2_01_FULL_57_28]|uniref:DUF541 domain-containing protein n=1 Tax=Candidatus Liptonbacteria bacterium RIFCSPHIGHO2_01_FULL_57_28 TaxID=1798647 RepID=A0A1G2CAK7_9BACT|nr:MAG: hypothetical protein A2855_02720 [Candidatus Liptonbacteria bacterium RIFCSPHIGHO2_01_FULL_57_28]
MVGVVAIVIVALSAWSWVAAVSRSTPPGATFSVSGQGKAVGVPDVAQFTFSVTTEGGKDVGALQEENNTKMNAAIEFVKQQGVEAKDIETLGYDIQPRYQSYDCRPVPYYGETTAMGAPEAIRVRAVQPCPPADIVGYTVMQTVQVKVRDFSKTGDIIAGVTAKGANNVSGLNFTTDDPTGLQNEARGKAIQNAKQQAEMMAKQGGFRLGRLISVNEGGYPGPYYYEKAALGMGGADVASAPAPSIEPGSQQVNVTVNLVYEIR